MLKLVAVAAALAFLAPPPAAHATDPPALPDGCKAQDGGILCEWRVNTRDPSAYTALVGSGGTSFYTFDLPVYGRDLATLLVRLEGEDRGWRATLVEDPNATDLQLSTSQHEPAQPGTVGIAQESGAHVFLANVSLPHALFLSTTAYAVGSHYVYGQGPPSVGEFTIVYFVKPVADGAKPSRPAATRADPQLGDSPFESLPPAIDITAAWFDDAELGDGLFDAHLALANLSSNDTGSGGISVVGSQGAIYALSFHVAGSDYAVQWSMPANADLPCRLLRAEGASTVTVGDPLCTYDVENSTLSAIIPEDAVGDPGPNERFTNLSAASSEISNDPTSTAKDSADHMRYAFALGGPSVWSQLNPRLDPVEVHTAWYKDPLSADNLPNTLQVLGAIVATITAIFGFVALRRSRKQTKELLSRVDELVALHDENAREGLLELGRLESDFTKLYHEGRINETQYQLASHRIVAAASRFALRRELGLDDGEPGDGPAREIPIQTEPERSLPRSAPKER